MRAILCTAFGDPLTLQDVPAPPLPARGVRIAVHAAGVNFADGLLTTGKYQERQEPPFIPGFEAAGVVLEVAPGVASCKPGDRVMAVPPCGCFAEEVVADASDIFVLPEAMDFATAAGFPIAYGTSHFGLVERCRLQAGETLLVHAAASGVGLTAVEVGAAVGARVIGTAGGPDKVAVALDHGAADGIDYKAEDIRSRVKELTGGRGVEVVYDPVGGEVFDASVRCTAQNGRILIVGFASGRVSSPPGNILLVKNISVIGYYWGAYRKLAPAAWRASLEQCLNWYAAGRLRPLVSQTLPLAQANDALALLKSRAATGKVVLTTGRP